MRDVITATGAASDRLKTYTEEPQRQLHEGFDFDDFRQLLVGTTFTSQEQQRDAELARRKGELMTDKERYLRQQQLRKEAFLNRYPIAPDGTLQFTVHVRVRCGLGIGDGRRKLQRVHNNGCLKLVLVV